MTTRKLADRLFSWASVIDAQTMEQAIMTAKMPFIWPHLALMADAHLGLGSTVGSVIPTVGAIMPAAVGVDIGCGMMAVRTPYTTEDIERAGRSASLSMLRHGIEGIIPLSPGNYNVKVYDYRTKTRIDTLNMTDGVDMADNLAPNWPLQLGSLGGGNHFIELVFDEENRIWMFLHSGSRGVGNKIAQKYIKIAREQCVRRWIPLPNSDLAYLVEGEREFWTYIRDLRWAQKFAMLNREEMMDRALIALDAYMENSSAPEETIHCHHNYTEEMPGELLQRFKRPKDHPGHVWLSRKGAIDATMDKPGLIPGSMGTASYVVKGKGHLQSLLSSPHGAGRVHSRTSARHTFSMDDLKNSMEGIDWNVSADFLDEHPGAYKDIDQVMADSSELIEVVHKFRQIINVKGM
jgi:tRNA-splicing ligase RtcB (3'-phosphate/5'-hydroxy nucleic acid ligase)